jgi:hypothetical protein
MSWAALLQALPEGISPRWIAYAWSWFCYLFRMGAVLFFLTPLYHYSCRFWTGKLPELNGSEDNADQESQTDQEL